MRHALRPHPAYRCDALRSLAVEIARPDAERLVLTYHLSGDMDGIALPPHAEPERRDRLWQHTCFEAFLRDGDGPGYVELNAAPSTEWASYRFAAHRSGMADAADVEPDRFQTKQATRSARLLRWSRAWHQFSFEISWLIPGLATPQLNLTAVIEETSGLRSYWALAHPDGEPDFHHPDCFVLDLPPPA